MDEIGDVDEFDETDKNEEDLENLNDLESTEYMALRRDADRVALLRQEHAARTEADFEKLTKTYDKLERNRIRRERRKEWERLDYLSVQDIDYSHVSVVPEPLEHEWWRKLMNGDFLDIIFDCPHEIHEQASSRNVRELLQKLNEGQKEVLYYRVIRRWSIQRIAAHRGQTDRNVLKVYSTMIESLRYKLYMRLLPRYIADAPLTLAQREFVAGNRDKYSDGKPKRQRRKKAALDSGE